jgi:hypothetical protein
MLIIVLIANSILAILCLVAAWQMLRLRRYLAKVADVLTAAEQSTHRILHRAPEFILTGQWGTHQLRQQYQELQRLQQTLAVLNLGWAFWQERILFVNRVSKRRMEYRNDRRKR